MKRLPVCLLMLVVLFLNISSALGVDCSISGDWDDDSIDGGDEAVFEIEIDPISGYIDYIFEDPFGEVVFSKTRKLVTNETELSFDTEEDWPDGKYSISLEWNELINGTECSDDFESDLQIDTSEEVEDFKVEINYTTEKVDFAKKCIPTQIIGGTNFDICGSGEKVLKNFADMVEVNGIGLTDQSTSLGSFDIEITACASDTELTSQIQTAVDLMSKYETKYEQADALKNDYLRDWNTCKSSLQNTSNALGDCELVAGSRVDFGAFLLYGFIMFWCGIFLHGLWLMWREGKEYEN